MSALDRLLPMPRMLEVDTVDLAIPPAEAWRLVRHGNLGGSAFIRTLFALREAPARLLGREPAESDTLAIDALVSTPERPGFQILADDPPHEVAVGAIGKVWKLDIPFLHVDDGDAFAAFAREGFVKVAWAIQLQPLGESGTRVVFEVRVDATDEASWRRFRRYFRLIGPGSHFIRRSLLAGLARELGTPESKEKERPMASDALLPDAEAQATDGITIAATPEEVWPWLVQMGCRRAGFYAIEALDNGGKRSAREIHEELVHPKVGDVLPATPRGDDGFEVLAIEPGRALVLGGLFDADRKKQLPFGAARPPRYWQVTWAFELEPQGAKSTRLRARARAAFPASGRLHAGWMRYAHHLMERAQLRHLAARAEGRLPRDDWRDVAEGMGGAAVMAAAFLTPFLRGARNHWGIDEATAARSYPGDELVTAPRWSWTHGIEIDAPVEGVWPWIAQIGADRAGFYSYQWLENVAGCRLRNAESVHAAWAVEKGGALLLHPKVPPLPIVAVAPGRHFVAFGRPDGAARAAGRPWVETSWLFFLEPLGAQRCRFISRYRCASSDDLVTRLEYGPALLEPIGFAMDRRMLLGVKERATARRRPVHFEESSFM